MKISEIRASTAASRKDLISLTHVYYIFHACASHFFLSGTLRRGGGQRRGRALESRCTGFSVQLHEREFIVGEFPGTRSLPVS